VVLDEVFSDVLQDPSLKSAYIIVDALDECVTDLPKLLNFIAQKSTLSRVKWIVSSRNWPEIEEWLETVGQKLSLELNADSVSTAIRFFIEHKVHQLAKQKSYKAEARDAVFRYLSSNADITFLWVALVCQNLEQTPRSRAVARLTAFPPGLDSLYGRMVDQIRSSDDAVLYKQILATTAVVYRPLTLHELASVAETLEDFSDSLDSLQEIVCLCGSLLTVREDTVYFVHQPAKDYLLKRAFAKIFPTGQEEVHHSIFSKIIQVMLKTLRRDFYCLQSPGFPIEKVKQLDLDPLAASRHSCVY
jgi:NACHT domain